MPSRLSRIFSRTSKDQEAKADKAIHQSRSGDASDPVPHCIASEFPSRDDKSGSGLDHADFPPDYTAGFASLDLSDAPSTDSPTVHETIAHPKALECFSRLRQSVASVDGLFGIDNATVIDIARSSNLASGEGADLLLSKLAEKRWAIYVSRAVDRFHAWLARAVPVDTLPTMRLLERDGTKGIITEPGYVKTPMRPIETSNMLPVDVLMVWHAYLLSPRAYLEDCVRLGRMDFWHTRFPWNAIAQCIDPSTFVFQAGAGAEANFARLTGHHWDNLVDGELKKVRCPNCQTEVQVPWTTCCQLVKGDTKSHGSLAENVDQMLASGEGFSDRGFKAACHRCLTPVTHDLLRAAKFCTDVNRLLQNHNPMPGTILGNRGYPFGYDFYKDVKWKGIYNMINNLLLCGLGQRILDQPRLGGKGNKESISHIRDLIGEVIANDHDYMRKVRESASFQMTRLERIGLRKMMSRYWKNSSPFALDLVGAAVRQGSFIEKMHDIDWLHSPALPATMTRLLLKYERFVIIMNDPTHMAVPTLDVDLAWHTHLLNPASYLKYVIGKTGQFIDHDDKIAETALNDAFAWTSKTYEKKYGGKYSECTCWYCEAVREQNTSTVSRIFSSKGKEVLLDIEQDPKKCNHISVHNAVRPADDAKYTAEAQNQAKKLEASYQKACARAEKKGSLPPKRIDYYWSTAYGYPVFIPAYPPLLYIPYTPTYYPASPGCMALSQGAFGSCAAGTCSGAVSAGGFGAGGCAGGTTGGCAGGQSLGGGCSGGGGGGGS